jgi:DNA-directed RNA polymerase specialized sigma24 family protein
LRERNPDAVAGLWERFFQPLVRVAATRMNPARCRVTSPEDLAQDIILEFAHLLGGPDGERRFPHLESRENLWKILVCLTVRAAFDHNTKEERRAKTLAGGSGLGNAGPAGFPGREPAPEFHAAVNDLFDKLADPDQPEQSERLQAVARMVMAGYRHAEIASALGCSEKSVGVKVKLIRRIWRERAGIAELP